MTDRSPEEWAEVIRADMGRSVAAIVAAGLHLIEARPHLPYGTWEPWCRDQVGISPSHATMLMALARNGAIANPAHGEDLPPSWRTLYELSKIDAERLEKAIADGWVTKDMERAEVRKLIQKLQYGVRRPDRPAITGPRPTPGQCRKLDADLTRCTRPEVADGLCFRDLQTAYRAYRERNTVRPFRRKLEAPTWPHEIRDGQTDAATERSARLSRQCLVRLDTKRNHWPCDRAGADRARAAGGAQDVPALPARPVEVARLLPGAEPYRRRQHLLQRLRARVVQSAGQGATSRSHCEEAQAPAMPFVRHLAARSRVPL